MQRVNVILTFLSDIFPWRMSNQAPKTVITLSTVIGVSSGKKGDSCGVFTENSCKENKKYTSRYKLTVVMATFLCYFAYFPFCVVKNWGLYLLMALVLICP